MQHKPFTTRLFHVFFLTAIVWGLLIAIYVIVPFSIDRMKTLYEAHPLACMGSGSFAAVFCSVWIATHARIAAVSNTNIHGLVAGMLGLKPAAPLNNRNILELLTVRTRKQF